jgi:gliding motility-associated-like protein/uncharacterized repeat protein (TIGR01451 family)
MSMFLRILYVTVLRTNRTALHRGLSKYLTLLLLLVATSAVAAPDLSITLSHTGNLRKGLSGNYVITVKNVGQSSKPANSLVSVTDIIPAGMIVGTPTGTGWSIIVRGNTIIANREDALPPGATYPVITIPVKVAVVSPNQITNTAIVANEFDTNTANNTASETVDTRRTMDLQVVSIDAPLNACINTTFTVAVNIRNNGPDSAVNGRFNFALSTVVNRMTLVSKRITAGGGVLGTGRFFDATGYADSVTLTNGGAATYVFNVTPTTPAPADLGIFEASLLRSATDLDIDASNPNVAVPTNPNQECDAAPSGGGCNNILRDTTYIRNKPSPAFAGSDQTLCGATTVTLNARRPATGIGKWSQASGPNTAVLVTPSAPATAVNNLINGLYAFVWTVSTGGCADAADTVLIRINAFPSTAMGGPDQNLCNTATTKMSATTPMVGTGRWRQLSGPNTATIADTILPATAVTGLVAGKYIFTWTTRNGTCPGSIDTVVINVNTSGPKANAGPDQELCNVNTTTLAGNNPTPGTGTWTQIEGPNIASITNPALFNTTLQNLIPGHYGFVWTIRNSSCPTTADTVQILVNALPTKANAGPDQTQFDDGLFIMNANTPVNGKGKWARISGSGVITNPAVPNTAITLQPGTHTILTWTITSGNCPPSIDTVTLTYIRQTDLSIVKSGAGNTYKTGSTVTYTITVENRGPSFVSGLSIKDTLPALLKNPSWTSVVTGVGVTLSPVAGNGSIINASGNMPFAAGNKIVITVTGTVAANAKGGDIISNTATVKAPITLPDPVPGNNTSTVTGIVPNNPPVAVDDQYTTPRDVPVSGNVLNNDSDPENQPLTVNTTPVTSPSHGTVVQRADGTFTYTPAPGFVGTDSYVYRVCDSEGACSQATVTINVTPAIVGIAIAKLATPATVVAGQTLTYTITVTNNGPSTIQPNEIFYVRENLPAGFVATTYNPSAGTYISVNGQWTNVTLSPGKSVTLTITGSVSPQFTGPVLINKAYLIPPAGVTNNTPDTATTTTPVTKSVEVVVTKTDNASVYTAGTIVQYNITVINKGPSGLVGATIKDLLPTGTTTATWTAVSLDGTQPPVTGTGSINQPLNINAGATVVYTFLLTVPSGFTGPLTNTASVIIPPGYTNINPAANTATDTDNPDPKWNLNIQKTGPAVATAGESITYQLLITNDGPSDAINQVVNDLLPQEVTGATWSVALKGSATTDVSNGSGNVNFKATIPAGQANQILVTIKGTISTGARGTINNSASITPPGKPPVVSNTANTVIENQTGLTLVKNGPPGGTIAAGAPINYVLYLNNAGPSDAVGIVLTDLVPSSITNVSWAVTTLGTATIATGAPANGNGNNISTTVHVPAGAGNQIMVQINGTVRPDRNGALLNTATAIIPNKDSVSASNFTMVLQKPVFQIVKSGPASANAGAPITYTIVVTNAGPSDAVNATISDVIGMFLINNISWKTTTTGAAVINTGSTGTGNMININANIPAGNNNKVIIKVNGTIPPGASGNIINRATVTGTDGSSVTSNEVITSITNKTNLGLTKDGPANATAGATLLYAVKITNNGPSNAIKAVLLDTLSTVMLLPKVQLFANGSAVVYSNQIVNNILQVVADVPVGDTNNILVLVSGQIAPSFSGQIKNQAVINSSDGSKTISNQVITNVASKPALMIIKNAPDTAVAGQSITYTIAINNTGLSDANGAVITDLIPATITNVKWTTAVTGNASVTSGATGSGNAVSLIGNIAAGVNNLITINITGTIAPGFAGDISNYAMGNITGVPPVYSDTVVTHVVRKPQLQISKAGPTNIAAGGRIQYTIAVTNDGPSDAAAVTISDLIDPAILQMGWSASASGGAIIQGNASGNTYSLTVTASIPAKTGRILITIGGTVSSAAAGTILNKAIASTPGMMPVSSEVATMVQNIPALSISKNGPVTLNAGEQINYRLVVTNYGQSDAKGVKIQDIIPPQITNTKWTTNLSGNAGIATGASGTGNNIFVTGLLPAGTGNHIFINITGTVLPDFEGQIFNIAGAVAEAADTVLSDTVITIVNNKPGIRIVKSAPDTLAAGSAITYKIVVTNPGPSDAKAINIADVVPVAITAVNWSAIALGNATLQNGKGSGNNISLNGSIPAGTNNLIVLTVKGNIAADFTGKIDNTARVNVPGMPPLSSNTTVTQVIKQIALSVTKAGLTRVPAGGTIDYLIAVRNYGPSDATGVQFRDTVPAAIKNVTWSVQNYGAATITAGASGTGNQIAVTADLPAGSNAHSILVLVKGTVDPAYKGPPLRNIAFASSPDQLVPAKDTSITTINIQPQVVIVKSGPALIDAGEQITYTLHITNAGPSDATNFTIGDAISTTILQPSWKVVANGNASVSQLTGNGNINIIGSIPVGIGNTIDIMVTGIVDPAFMGDTILNIAAVTAEGQRPDLTSVTTLVTRRADLRVVKSGPGNAVSGEKIVYTITINNVGPSNVTGASISDIIPTGILQPIWTATATGANTTVSAGSGVGNVNITADIPAKTGSITIVINGIVDPSTANNSKITNTVVVTPQKNMVNGPVIAMAVTNISKQADLVMVKSGPANRIAGQDITYQLLVTNKGISDVNNALITDVVPANINVTTATVNTIGNASATTPIVTGNTITLNGDIAGGTGNAIIVTINGIINPMATGSITNTATVAPPADVTETNAANNSSSITTKLDTDLGLQISKSAPATVNVKDPITYVITVTNNGLSDANGLVVRDIIPSDISNITWTATATGNAQIAPATGTESNIQLNGRIGGSNTGTITITVNGMVNTDAGNTITNIATATAGGTKTSTIVTSVNKSVDLRINKTAPTAMFAGETINYVITVTNAGPADAIAATIQDIIPAAITNVTWTAIGQNGATVSKAGDTGNNITLQANIPANTGLVTINVTGTVNPAAKDTLVNTATATPAPGVVDPRPASVTVKTAITSATGIVITKAGPTRISAGNGIAYLLQIRNNGPSAATGVTIKDTLNVAIGNVTWNASATGATITDAGSGRGNVNLVADIPVGGLITVTINGTTDPAFNGTIMNRAVAATTTQSVVSNEINTNVIQQTGLTINKSGPMKVAAGSNISYTITVNNNGPSTATGVTISDPLPAFIQQVTWSAQASGSAVITGGPINNQTGDVNFKADIPAGGNNTIQVTITGVVVPFASGTLENIATVTPANGMEVADTVQTTVLITPGIRLVKAGPDTAAAGSIISYEVDVYNDGPSEALNLKVADMLPPQLQQIDWSATATGSASINGGDLQHQTGNVNLTGIVPAGAGNVIIITVRGQLLSSFSGQLENTASATIEGSNYLSNKVITQVVNKPGLQLVKSGPSTGIAGSNINYNLQLGNEGPSDASNIVVNDVLPVQLQNGTWSAVAVGAATINGGNISNRTGNVTLTANVPAGNENYITITVDGNIDPLFTGTIKNKASYAFNGTTVSTPEVLTIVSAKTDLQINKSGPSALSAGSNINYSLLITNDGPSTARGIVIQDMVPASVKNVSWQAVAIGATLHGNSSGTGNDVQVNADLPAGPGHSILVNIAGTVASSQTEVIQNSATVSINGKVAAQDVLETRIIPSTASVLFTKSGPAKANAGDNISYTIDLGNTGTADLLNIKVMDLIPAMVSNVTWEIILQGAASLNSRTPTTGAGNLISFAADVPAGAGNGVQVNIKGVINPDVADTITNIAKATDANGNVYTSTIKTKVSKKAVLAIEKIGPAVINAGDAISYVITATNEGPSNAAGIKLTDLVPAAITGVSWTASAGGNAAITSTSAGTGNNVSVIGNISGGEGNFIQVTISGVVPANTTATSIRNTAILTAPDGSVTPSETIVTTVISRNMDLVINKSGPSITNVGDSIQYVLTARNNGPAAGDGAIITDVLPQNMQGAYVSVLSVTGGVTNIQSTLTGNTLNITTGVFPAGSMVRLAIKGLVSGGTQLINQAVIAVPEGATDTDLSNNTSELVITNINTINTVKTADIQLKKELLTNQPVHTGSLVEFQLTLNNAGPDTALMLLVRDTLSNNLALFGDITTSEGTASYDPVSRILTWKIDQLTVMQLVTLRFTARVTFNATLVNSATAMGAVNDPDLSNNTARSREVVVSGEEVFIPNVITPNGDGKNDEFKIIDVSRYPNSSLFIYNRWGNMVYQTKNYANNWNGSGLSEGTYYYILKLRTSTGEKIYKGWIELIR